MRIFVSFSRHAQLWVGVVVAWALFSCSESPVFLQRKNGEFCERHQDCASQLCRLDDRGDGVCSSPKIRTYQSGCKKHSDCAHDVCVQEREGDSYCSQRCESSCTNSYQCVPTSLELSSRKICIQSRLNRRALGEVCRDWMDCGSGICIGGVFQLDGGWCSKPCSDQEPCPKDYTCFTLGDEKIYTILNQRGQASLGRSVCMFNSYVAKLSGLPPQGLQGDWSTGTLSATQIYRAQTGEWQAPTGDTESISIYIGGVYIRASYTAKEQGACVERRSHYEEGRIVVQNNEATFIPSEGVIRQESSCSPEQASTKSHVMPSQTLQWTLDTSQRTHFLSLGQGTLKLKLQKLQCHGSQCGSCSSSPECKWDGKCLQGPQGCIVGQSADCKQSYNCKQQGKCTKGTMGCEAGEGDCSRSQGCKQHGLCGRVQRDAQNSNFKWVSVWVCEAKSEQHCQQSDACKQRGLCGWNGRRCVSCPRSLGCRTRGACGTAKGVCVVDNDADCQQSNDCRTLGHCSRIAADGKYKCIARSDSDCFGKDVCRTQNRCTAHEGRCVTCRESEGCKKSGRCSFQSKVGCVVGGRDDCLQSEGCKLEGNCSKVKGQCLAELSGDCVRSEACKKEKRCQVKNHRCVTCKESLRCEQEGLCSGDVFCSASSETDCLQSTRCKRDGMCALTQGKCGPCRPSTACFREGRCHLGKGVCEVGGESDCKQSEICQKDKRCRFSTVKKICVLCREVEDCSLSGKCSWGKGSCQAASDADCKVSKVCLTNKWCRAVNGLCVACSQTPECQTLGQCSSGQTSCEVRFDWDCQASQLCRRDGKCKAEKGQCIACSASEGCSKEGRCSLGQDLRTCVARSSVDCAQSDACKKDDRCFWERGICVTCKQTKGCSSEGKCSAGPIGCYPKFDDDCKRSDACLRQGLCRAVNGRCVACKDAPECKTQGRCTQGATSCVVKTHQDCRASQMCTTDGKCSRKDDTTCEASSDADCQLGHVCKVEKKCKASNGECVP